MEYLKALNVIIYMISGVVAGYCFLRISFYPVLKLLVDEKELYSDPKLKKLINIFYHARLYPWPIWNDDKRSAWIKAWWKYALSGLVSFIILAITLYIHDTIK
jgi:hypothetical protein